MSEVTNETAASEVTTIADLPHFTDKGETIEATAKELVNRGLTINGVTASLNDISAYARTNLFPSVGTAAKEPGQRGPKGSVLSVPMNGAFTVTLRR